MEKVKLGIFLPGVNLQHDKYFNTYCGKNTNCGIIRIRGGTIYVVFEK